MILQTKEKTEKFIQDNLVIDNDAKNKYGEVFTPLVLINELLDKLEEENKEIFSNPQTKWLDPANGIGNFPMMVFHRLMKGLENVILDTDERQSHIIQNMLYMVELQEKNVNISKNIFGDKANIICGNFLIDDCFNGVNFDVIIGNPPFQKPNKTEGRSSLWDKFIIRSMDKLKDDGYLCFITPSSWRKPAHKLYNDMTQKSQLVYLHIYGVKECKKIFNVNSRVDLYILHKKQKYKDTIVVDEKDIMSKLNLSNWHFIPNFGLDVFSPIMTTKDNGIKIIFSKLHFQVNTKSQQNGVVSKVKTPDHNFPIRHSHTRKNGEIIFWCNADDIKNKKLLGVPKVILIRGNYTYPLNDFEGKYALSNYSFGIPISTKEEGDAIVKAVNSDKFDILLKATKWSMGFTHHNMFKYIVEDFYKYF